MIDGFIVVMKNDCLMFIFVERSRNVLVKLMLVYRSVCVWFSVSSMLIMIRLSMSYGI